MTSMWDNYHAMTYGRFDICDPEGTMDYIKAAEFTRERIEQIRQVEIDIKWLHIDEERDYENIKSCADGKRTPRRAVVAPIRNSQTSYAARALWLFCKKDSLN